MKRMILSAIAVVLTAMVRAQGVPFVIDTTFEPSLPFLQKVWTGNYDGLDPNSRQKLTISRQLTLYADMTFVNETKGSAEVNPTTVTFKLERGTYSYDGATKTITYSVTADSTLDLRTFLKKENLTYVVNHYTGADKERQVKEQAQFTSAATDDDRQWVAFDLQLKSPIDPNRDAVYVMTGSALSTAGITRPVTGEAQGPEVWYDLQGRRVASPTSGVYIVNGRKVILTRARYARAW